MICLPGSGKIRINYLEFFSMKDLFLSSIFNYQYKLMDVSFVL